MYIKITNNKTDEVLYYPYNENNLKQCEFLDKISYTVEIVNK